jgi:hypothetical protein
VNAVIADCPRCGTDLEATPGAVRCAICRHEFEIEAPPPAPPPIPTPPKRRPEPSGVGVVATLVAAVGILIGICAIAETSKLAAPIVEAMAALALIIIGCSGVLCARLDVIAYRLRKD